jgi:hypothetical protein
MRTAPFWVITRHVETKKIAVLCYFVAEARNHAMFIYVAIFCMSLGFG